MTQFLRSLVSASFITSRALHCSPRGLDSQKPCPEVIMLLSSFGLLFHKTLGLQDIKFNYKQNIFNSIQFKLKTFIFIWVKIDHSTETSLTWLKSNFNKLMGILTRPQVFLVMESESLDRDWQLVRSENLRGNERKQITRLSQSKETSDLFTIVGRL